MRKSIFACLVVLAVAIPSSWAMAESNVVVSIKPLHSWVQGVMGDTGKAQWLVKGVSSPHNFHLKPSQMRMLSNADLVIYVSESFETFLRSALAVLPDSVHKTALAQTPQLELLQLREGGAWEGHAEEHGHHHHHHHDDHSSSESDNVHAEYDMHVWLDPVRAKIMVDAVAHALTKVFPDKKDVYHANAEKLKKQLDGLHQDLQAELAEVRTIPYLVFHDAYQYFEKRYQLNAVGSISVSPEDWPSPKRIQSIRARLEETKARCVFREPQFSDKLIQTVTAGMDIRKGVLDPLGAGVEAGSQAYAGLMRQLAANLKNCLAPSAS